MGDSRYRVLLVEDDSIIALAQRQSLSLEGFEVVWAASGEAGVEAVRGSYRAGTSEGPDLVLMDIDLGAGIDGIEATRRILEIQDLPVLFLTGHSEREYADRADQIGAYGYLLKNSGIRVITTSIKMALRLFEARKKLKEREAELADNEARLRFALEGSNDGVWDVWMKTGQAYLSPRDCEMLGYGVLEAAQTIENWSQLVHPEDMPETLDRLNAHLGGREPLFVVDQRLKTKSGDYKWVRTRGKVVMRDDHGEALRMTGTHTDLSELLSRDGHIAELERQIRALKDEKK